MKAKAFTLIEVVGVLAIFTVLAALTAPAVIRQVDRARGTRERSDLRTFAGGLERSVVRSKSVPAGAGVAAAVAAESSLPAAQISSTAWGTQRAFVVDPTASIGSGLPYTQSGNAGLPSRPSNLRVLLLSTLSKAHPLTAAETASTAPNFEAIWNAAELTKPATWGLWLGAPEDLCIQRVNLEPLFRRLILVNHDPYTTPGFSIDNAAATALASGIAVWDAHYLEGSVINLYSGTNLQTRHLLTDDASFVYELGAWRASLGPGALTSALPDTFARSARRFLDAPWNPIAQQGATPPPILTALCSFMLNYSMWADQCPHFGYHGNTPVGNPGNVPEYQMLNAFGRNNGFIDTFSGANGLLK